MMKFTLKHIQSITDGGASAPSPNVLADYSGLNENV